MPYIISPVAALWAFCLAAVVDIIVDKEYLANLHPFIIEHKRII